MDAGVALRSRILDRVPGGLFHLDAGGRILYLNEGVRRGLVERGEDPDAVQGRLFEEAFPGPECQAVREAIHRAREDGRVHRLETHGPVPGQWMAVEVLPSGDGVTLSLRDITERLAGEAALRASEERYRALFEDDVTGNYVASVEGTLLACNRTFVELLGLPSMESAVGMGLERIAPAQDREALVRLIREDQRVDYYEMTLRRGDQGHVHVIGNARGIFDAQGRLVEIHGHILDITDRRALEEQLRQSQKMEAVGRLAGGVAHDFNNLLTAITGHVDLMLEDVSPSSPMASDLGLVREAARRAGTLTNQLLAFSRRQVLRPRLIDLNQVVTGVEGMLRRLIGEDVSLVTILAEDLPATRADPNQLEQVLMNLVVNARDAMPGGGTLCIRTRVSQGARSGGAGGAADEGVAATGETGVVLEVSDTGEGIPEDIQDRIFEPFFTTKEDGRGTGLGLSMVYGIVMQSGGRVEVDSAPGAGTSVRLHLPASADPLSQVVADPQDAEGEVTGGSETILLVEDEGVVRDLASRVLRRLGYRVIPASGPEEALQRLEGPRAVGIHLLVTDVVMPGMTGPALATRVGSLVPGVVVLYTSGYARETLSRGADRVVDGPFLPKPFAPAELARAVRSALDAGAEGVGGVQDVRPLVS
jgi:two-component system, cell cycle sensor histidine kinase and response regulator CckA